MTPTEAIFLETHQVKFVLAQFVDIHGTAKTKAVPASHFEDILDPVLASRVSRSGDWDAAQQTSWQWAIHQRSRWCHGCLPMVCWACSRATVTTIPFVSAD